MGTGCARGRVAGGHDEDIGRYGTVRTICLILEWQIKLEELKPGQQLFVPGGWEGLSDGRTLMHIVERVSPVAYNFITCNPASGASLSV